MATDPVISTEMIVGKGIMSDPVYEKTISLETGQPIWDRFFNVAPLVLIGTREPDGSYDLAPKHMVAQMGRQNYFGFVCTPQHQTYHNAKREGAFTVSYPRPAQIILTSLSAAPRCEDGSKPSLRALQTFPASKIDGVFVQDAYLYLECELYRVIDDFALDSLITGRIIAAHVHESALRTMDRDDHDLIHRSPMLAYLHPGRYAKIDRSFSFPFSVESIDDEK